MAEKPAAERTELPTQRRLQKAREEGQTPQSQDLTAAVSLVALLLTIAVLAPHLFDWFKLKVESGLAGQIGVFADARSFITFFNDKILDATVITLPILAALGVAGLAATVAVTGFSFAPGAIRLKWNAINPASVIQSLFNTRSLIRLLASIAKLFFVGLIVWLYLRSKMDTLATLRWAWSTQIITMIAKIILGLGLRVGVVVIALGIVDALYQKWQYTSELKMTRQEVKQERKDGEGSPEVKARIRRIQVEMSMKRLMQDVPKANVILVNPTHVAVALRYDPKKMDAPILIAKGADHVAERIRKIGRSYGIPIIRRPEVARTIYATVKPGQPIPESLYVAVAEVLAMLYRLRQKRKMSQNS